MVEVSPFGGKVGGAMERMFVRLFDGFKPDGEPADDVTFGPYSHTNRDTSGKLFMHRASGKVDKLTIVNARSFYNHAYYNQTMFFAGHPENGVTEFEAHKAIPARRAMDVQPARDGDGNGKEGRK